MTADEPIIVDEQPTWGPSPLRDVYMHWIVWHEMEMIRREMFLRALPEEFHYARPATQQPGGGPIV